MDEQSNKLKVLYQDIKRILFDFYVLITIVLFIFVIMAAMTVVR
jgi:hypothetical protein